MERVALVTGGTRGIGAAISSALKQDGYKLAATYFGSDEAAKKVSTDIGTTTYKWSLSNYNSSVKV